MSIKITEQECLSRLKGKYPEDTFSIVSYKNMTSKITIRCDICGNEATFSNPSNLLGSPRKRICDYCNPVSFIAKGKIKNKAIEDWFSNQSKLTLLNFEKHPTQNYNVVKFKCNDCGAEETRRTTIFLDNPVCSSCSHRKLNAASYQKTLPSDYTLISDFKTMEDKVLIRHTCGFIWNVKPHHLQYLLQNNYVGCPKCNERGSKGEMTITNFLTEKNIEFYREQRFDWSSNKKFRYDFYVPQYKLVIEYMGEQHYREVSIFRGTLAERQELDRIKKEEALANGLNYLDISYKDYKNISIILDKWFNDYPNGVEPK